MKKCFTFSLAAVLLLSICSCNQNRSEKEAFLKDIAEAGNGVYEQETDFHHSNVISDQAVQTVDSSAKAELVVSIDGSDRQLAYHDTLFYPVGETTVYRYYIGGDEDCTVLRQHRAIHGSHLDCTTFCIFFAKLHKSPCQ